LATTIGTELARLLKDRGRDIGRNNFPRTVETRRHDRQSADRAASRHENPFAEQRSGAADRMQHDRERLRKGSFID